MRVGGVSAVEIYVQGLEVEGVFGIFVAVVVSRGALGGCGRWGGL